MSILPLPPTLYRYYLPGTGLDLRLVGFTTHLRCQFVYYYGHEHIHTRLTTFYLPA